MAKINLIQRVVMEVNSKLIFIDFLLIYIYIYEICEAYEQEAK